MREKFEELRKRAKEELESIGTMKLLADLKTKFIGKNGEIRALLRGMKDVPSEEKASFGKMVNELNDEVSGYFEKKEAELKELERSILYKKQAVDVTLPGKKPAFGSLHPLNIVKNKILDAFCGMGFEIFEGPEIDSDYYCFQALNIPKDHPARDMQDTFFVEKREDGNHAVLRTHTSSVQVRTMERQKPPIRIIAPGRVFRNEAISARAHCIFHQIEGLYIDKGVSFADLKQSLLYFAREMFGANTRIRLRPSYFPFTEPSAEMDVSCNLCGGKGCNVCKGTSWLEIMGCGMVDPNVLKASGIDPDVYSGFAFGMGVERIAMLKYGVNDLRMYFENDIRFLNQFRSSI